MQFVHPPGTADWGNQLILESLRRAFEYLLETIVILLVAALTALVIAGFVFRYVGYALAWYDELASVGLVWLTYYGSALAALKGAHIGVPGFVNAMPPRLRLAVTILAEACVFIFFIMLAWTGFKVLMVLAGDGMVSLPWVPLQLTDSAIPIGAVLFIMAEALRLPQVLRDARGRGFVDTETLEAISHGAPGGDGGSATAKRDGSAPP
jgi:TRAP-type C4-dicarboxylate transport system permease small subunit